MTNNLDISYTGLDLIKSFEGLRLDAYQDSRGIWTIGYGTTYLSDGSKVTADTPSIDEATAIDLLHYGCRTAIHCVNNNVQVDLIQNQFDALVTLVYNIGPGAFETSTLLKIINGDVDGDLKAAWLAWDHSNGQVSQGLLRRRQAELDLYNTTNY
jgi:lysozyme